MQTTGTNIVSEWLRSLHLGRYADSFIDNGYDDLEICKQVGDPDLDAIGVFNPVHRARLLHSVRTLREEGAASVYFSLEESVAVHEECLLAGGTESSSSTTTNSSSARSSRSGLGLGGSMGQVAQSGGGTVAAASGSDKASVSDVLMLTSDDVAKYLDEYEEGKAELVKIPRVQLKMLLREKLAQDGIILVNQPYSTPDGDRGYLEGLASRYADLFSTHYGDVLADLEDLRRSDHMHTPSPATNTSNNSTSTQSTQSINQSHQQQQLSTGGGRGGGATTPPGTYSPPGTPGQSGSRCGSGDGDGMSGSHSHLNIYVPGKYLPSSCLSDKEEDEIYGFGYGVYGAQIVRQQQQRLLGVQQATSHQPLLLQHQQNYQTCLSPRSAYFYEFPPNEQNYTNTGKKKTTFSRFLRGLKTSHRKEKHGASSPKHGRSSGRGVPQRVDTPDSVLHSGLGLNDLGHHTVLRSMVDPRDYDRLCNLQLNGEPNTFEETIYKLKLQEAMRKREKFTKEHEDILRDIKQGLLHLGKEGFRGPLSEDDTYMYDEDARTMLSLGPNHSTSTTVNTPNHHHHKHQQQQHPRPPHHWYDEPPYESDPEDFLMGSSPGAPTATIVQNGRVCYTSTGGGIIMGGGMGGIDEYVSSCRNDGARHRLSGGINLMEEGVISLRSAGDISLPRDGICSRETPRRGLILPQAGYPPTIIPLTHPRDRSEGSTANTTAATTADYDCSPDMHTLTSRLSTLSMDKNRHYHHHHHPDSPDSPPNCQMPSPSAYHHLYTTPHHYTAQPATVASIHHVQEHQHLQRMQLLLQQQLAGFRIGSRGKVMGHGMYSRSEDGMSRSGSSECGEEDEDGFGGGDGGGGGGTNSGEQIATVHVSSDSKNSTSSTVASLVGKVRGLREDVQRKISRMKNEHGSSNDQSKQRAAASASEQAIPYSASSVESLPSGSGSSTQALVRAGSNHSSISAEDGEPSPTEPRIIGRAKALVDSTSSPYDKDALKFKKGDIIEILSMNASGQWKGICSGRKGSFKFINVELMSERNNGTSKPSEKAKHQHSLMQNQSQMQTPWQQPYALTCRPKTVEDLLQQLGMHEHISVLVLNGYEDLEQFKELEASDLDYLGIMDVDEREKILTAVQLMHDIDSCSEEDLPYSSSEGETSGRPINLDHHSETHLNRSYARKRSPFGRRRQFPRDSGCYDAPISSNKHTSSGAPSSGTHQQPHEHERLHNTSTVSESSCCDTTNNLDSVVEQCNNEILARVRQAQKNALNLKEDPYQPNITSVASGVVEKKLAKDSYVSVHGHTTLVDPCRRNLLNRTTKSKPQLQHTNDDVCEADQKLNSVKYIVGTSNSDSPDVISHVTSNKGCLSEKSSDSGVSSSSLSSKDSKIIAGIPTSVVQNITENPFVSNCANKSSTVSTATVETKGLLADENHFQ